MLKWIAVIDQKYFPGWQRNKDGVEECYATIAELYIEAITAQGANDVAEAWIKSEGILDSFVSQLVCDTLLGNSSLNPLKSAK